MKTENIEDDIIIDEDDEIEEDSEISYNISSSPRLNVFELTKILSYRSQQLFNKAKTTLTPEEINKIGKETISPEDLVIEELKLGKIPLQIIRQFSYGRQEIKKINDLKILIQPPSLFDY